MDEGSFCAGYLGGGPGICKGDSGKKSPLAPALLLCQSHPSELGPSGFVVTRQPKESNCKASVHQPKCWAFI